MRGIYIGVDPGTNGGFAVIDTDNGERVFPWDDKLFVEEMARCKDDFGFYAEKIVACVERVGAMPGQGVTGMFHFGKNAGFIEGVLTALGIPYQLVVPRKWKAEFGLSGIKADSIEVCRKLFPEVSLRASDRCRKDSDGMAEALLMAEYARRKM